MKRFLRICRNALLILLAAGLLFLLAVFCFHRFRCSITIHELETAGYANLTDIGGRRLNVVQRGNPDGGKTLVALSGMRMGAMSLAMQPVEELLDGDWRIVYADRAGYGLSDDSSAPQTLEQVVSDYRAALQAAGVEPPYVLLPHSIGGLYATYWESVYPEEIAGIVFLDCSVPSADEDYLTQTCGYVTLHRNDAYAAKLGLKRLTKQLPQLPDVYDAMMQEYAAQIGRYQPVSLAQCSESELEMSLYREADAVIVTNAIPKTFVSVSWAMRTRADFDLRYDWMNRQRVFQGYALVQFSEEELSQLADSYITNCTALTEQQLMPYLEKLGSCTYEALPGDHMIFAQQPEAVAGIINRFAERLQTDY